MKNVKKFKTNQIISVCDEKGKLLGTYIAHSYTIEGDHIHAVICGTGNYEYNWDKLDSSTKYYLRMNFEKEGLLIKNK